MGQLSKTGGIEGEKLPPLAWALLALAVVLFVVGGLMLVFNMDWGGPREVWYAVAGVCLVGGCAALFFFFDKYGRL